MAFSYLVMHEKFSLVCGNEVKALVLGEKIGRMEMMDENEKGNDFEPCLAGKKVRKENK